MLHLSHRFTRNLFLESLMYHFRVGLLMSLPILSLKMYNVHVPVVPFLIGGSLLYNTGLVSTIHQRESAKGLHVSPLSRTSLILPTPSHPLDLHRAPHVSSLGHAPVSQWLSVLHMAMYVSTLLSQFIPPSSSLLFP